MKVLSTIFLLSFFLFIESSSAQLNLVPNPSFEDTIQNNGPLVKNWNTNIGTADYFSPYYTFDGFKTPINVRGSQIAKNGVAYFGIFFLDLRRFDTREYLQIELLSSLSANEKYEIEFYLSLADSFYLAVSAEDIGIYFSDSLIPNNFDHKVKELQPYYSSDTSWDASNKIE